MARLDEHTSLIVVKEGAKLHIKIYYSRDGIKRYKTNIYVKDKVQFIKDKGFRKGNALSPASFQEDKSRLDELQLKIETLIDDFLREHLVKPTAEQLDALLENHKGSSQKSYTYICDFLREYTENFNSKERNSKSVVRALDSALTQFWSHKNRKYYFNEIDEKFIGDFIDYLLFEKPKRLSNSKTDIRRPSHHLHSPVVFDHEFGMNNNTLVKRLDAFRSFIIWAINNKGVNIDYNKVKEALKKAKKDKSITEYTNIEFAFRTMDDVKLLASKEFENTIKDDTYVENVSGAEKPKGVSRDVLIRTKDFFIISILTGNRVSDLRAIKRHHVSMGKQTAKKTKGQFLLNSNKSVLQLLEKHDYNMNMSDPKYNKCIKVVLKQFYQNFLHQKDKMVYVIERRGRHEQVQEVEYFNLAASHSGRRSFATIAYHESNKSKRSIMQFTGHTSEKEFDKYIQLAPEEDIKDFADFMSI
ncbi:phage integrase SAM-like domain-containing protein [Pontibacter chinhatensis]|uniref:Phage integrase SAM-like domain-containing protein n=1 Tax=Pontibacter chinhatensis TaxID=1436961 RepID=A0A1I2ZV14_9BACT|nr:phage integrase SAM-like domain-containing protein [Pontibacter chinhatensis]SFH41752.1 Phage integrase SAM-like domain-containing protein [Pontibacter chinhatensis]